MKKCKLCGVEKDESEFHRNRGHFDGLSEKCKNCKSSYDRWFAKNPTPTKRRRNGTIKNIYRHIEKYGLTPDDYEAMLERQGGVCGICGHVPNGRRLCVDHDHATGKVRGLLCNGCNVALGAAKDEVSVLMRMIDYLKSYL